MIRAAAIALGPVIAAMVIWGCAGEPEEQLTPEEPQVQEEQTEVVEEAVVEEAEEEKPTGPSVKKQPVTIYQRAGTRMLMLKPVGASIIWFDSPVERGRQLVRLVLEGVRAKGAFRPAPSGLTYHEVYVDDRRIAWVDLSGEGVAKIDGADMEEAIVACLARTLVDNLVEAKRVGILVDGEPRRTLAGHVDISRTFDGREWPVFGKESR